MIYVYCILLIKDWEVYIGTPWLPHIRSTHLKKTCEQKTTKTCSSTGIISIFFHWSYQQGSLSFTKKSTFPTTMCPPFHFWPVSFLLEVPFSWPLQRNVPGPHRAQDTRCTPFPRPTGYGSRHPRDETTQGANVLNFLVVPMTPLMTSIPAYTGYLWIRKIIIQQKHAKVEGFVNLGCWGDLQFICYDNFV